MDSFFTIRTTFVRELENYECENNKPNSSKSQKTEDDDPHMNLSSLMGYNIMNLSSLMGDNIMNLGNHLRNAESPQEDHHRNVESLMGIDHLVSECGES